MTSHDAPHLRRTTLTVMTWGCLSMPMLLMVVLMLVLTTPPFPPLPSPHSPTSPTDGQGCARRGSARAGAAADAGTREATIAITSPHFAASRIHHVLVMMFVAAVTRIVPRLPTWQFGSTLRRTSWASVEEVAATRTATWRTTPLFPCRSVASRGARGAHQPAVRSQYLEVAFTYGWRMTRASLSGKSVS